MCTKQWCGVCQEHTPKKSLRVKNKAIAHVCQCCQLTTSVRDLSDGTTYHVKLSEEQDAVH